jgi:hypothetical protein
MSPYIPIELRKLVREDASERCGYCQSAEKWLGIAHEVEHVVPTAEGGETVRDNVWIACRRCNSFKASRAAGVDPITNQTVRLFHPRNDRWLDHFRWSIDGTRIVGVTAIGRATVETLQMNHLLIVCTRQLWVRLGIHPPQD